MVFSSFSLLFCKLFTTLLSLLQLLFKHRDFWILAARLTVALNTKEKDICDERHATFASYFLRFWKCVLLIVVVVVVSSTSMTKQGEFLYKMLSEVPNHKIVFFLGIVMYMSLYYHVTRIRYGR